jgi:hypothetical protein
MRRGTRTSVEPSLRGERDVAATRMVPRVSAAQTESTTSMGPDAGRWMRRGGHADGPENTGGATGKHNLDGTQSGEVNATSQQRGRSRGCARGAPRGTTLLGPGHGR